jgi:hypothetical protein
MQTSWANIFLRGTNSPQNKHGHRLSQVAFSGQLCAYQGQLQISHFDTRVKIFNLGNNTWLVYSVGMIATNQVCPKAKTTSPFTISSGQTISVQPGCHIPTMDHVITAYDSDDFNIHSTWLDWTMTLGQLFDHQDTEQILE